MKYELTKETKQLWSATLYRIEALKSFGNITEGDLGGWIEKESNLSQDGNCWVYGNAEVAGNARVAGDAGVSGNARVYNNALVYDNAKLYDNARVYGNARIYDNAIVLGDARVSCNAEVSKNAVVCDNAWVSGKDKCTKRVYTLNLSRDRMTVTDNHVNIGCHQYTLEYWIKNYKKIGVAAGYSKDEIEGYKNILHALTHFVGDQG
jgi:carbonic anhydrase/acetyltransferase-like protein (isoleucine patch superfamily)